MAYPCDFARCFRRAYRCAVLGGVQLVAERLTDRTGKFRALTTGNRMERLEYRFIAAFILKDTNGCLRKGMRRMDKDISVIETTGIAKLLRRCPFLLRWLPKCKKNQNGKVRISKEIKAKNDVKVKSRSRRQ